MGGPDTRGLTLDAGALIAFEARDRRVEVLLQRAIDLKRPIVLPAGVLAQVWRKGARQSRIAALLNARPVVVEDLTRERAKAAGELCAIAGTADIVDASVVVSAWRHGRTVVTSDPDDLMRLDGSLTVVRV